MSDLDFRKLLDAFEDAIVIGDRAGSIVYANPAVGNLLGWTLEDLQGSPLTLLIPPKLRSRHRAGFNRARATRQHRVLGKPMRVPVLRANGTELRAEMVISAFRGGAGEELFIATLRRSEAPSSSDESPTLRYLHGLSTLADQLPKSQDATSFARVLETLASAHLGACAVRLWLAASSDGLRLVNRNPLTELEEPPLGVMRVSEGSSLVAEAARARRCCLSPRPEPHSDEARWRESRGIVSVAAFPLLENDELLGSVHFLSAEPWSEELAAALRLLSGLLARVLLDHRRHELDENTRSAVLLGQALADLTGQLVSLSEADTQSFLEAVIDWGQRLTGADQASLVLRDPHEALWRVRACAGYKTSVEGADIPDGLGLTGLVAASGQAVLVPEYQQFELAVPRLRQRGVRAALGVPLRQSGQVIGVLELETKRREKQFTETDLGKAQALADVAALAISQAR